MCRVPIELESQIKSHSWGGWLMNRKTDAWDSWGTLLMLLTSLNWEYPTPSVLTQITYQQQRNSPRKSSSALPKYICTKEGMRELLWLCYHQQGDWAVQHSSASEGFDITEGIMT